MCNKEVKILILKLLKNLKGIVQNVYLNNYYLSFKQTSAATIQLPQGYVLKVSKDVGFYVHLFISL
jgi:hypothetical protein